MVTDWNAEERERYGVLIDEEMRKGCWVICFLALLLFPAFFFLDYFAHHQVHVNLWKSRAVTTSVFAILFSYINVYKKTYNPYIVSYLACVIASLALTVKCIITGGFVSAYYAGLMLVMVATIVVFPAGVRWISLLLGTEIFVYVIGCLYKSGFTLDQDKAILNNMHMILSTGFIGIIGSGWSEKSRFLSFDRYLQLEKAKKEINLSKQMLQFELASEQSNVQMLIMEITNKKADLERALDLRKEFISLASHELNTPLTSLKLITQMFQQKMKKDGVISSSDLSRLLRTYDEQILLLTRIVSDMLDISKIENGRLALIKNRIELSSLVSKVVEFSSSAYQNEINFSSEGTFFGDWDQHRIEQVLLNLITNAIKYGQGNPIHVDLAVKDDSVVIRVKDSGIGIPDDMKDRIFGRFERAVNPNQFAGLGIGLYIANQIVRAHEGRIEVTSKLGEGSEFSVILPLSSEEAIA
jgi:signal transduction histidine kinase